jgi:hypothetical protein
MSRYDDGGDGPEYNNATKLWQANIRRALKGKRGRQALRDLRDALLALPEKRLIERALCTVGGEQRVMRETAGLEKFMDEEWAKGERDDLRGLILEVGSGVCVVGAYVWWKKVKAGMDPTEAFEALPMLPDTDHSIDETAHEAVAVGMAGVLAWELAWRNDELWGGLSAEERYVTCLAWIDAELAAA